VVSGGDSLAIERLVVGVSVARQNTSDLQHMLGSIDVVEIKAPLPNSPLRHPANRRRGRKSA
jgi:hypothetical protein